MKKFKMFFAVVLTVLLISAPAFANGEPECCPDTVIKNNKITLKDNNVLKGNDNTGIQGNKNHHNTVIGETTVESVEVKVRKIEVDSHDKTWNKTFIKGNVNNSTHDSHDDNSVDNSVDKSGNNRNNDYSGDFRNVTGDVATKGGTVNSGKFSGNDGFLNTGNMQKGMQFGRNNIAINGGGHAHISDHSGNSHNSGIIEQSKNNSGIIVNQQQNGGKGGGYPYPYATTGATNGEVAQEPGQGGGGHHNNTVNAMVDNSTTIVEDKREFAPGPASVIAGFADYVGSETPGYVYSTIDEMLTFGRVFTESQLISMAGDRGIRNAIVDITMMDSNMARQKPTIHPTAKEKTITFYYKAAVPSPVRRGAFVTVAMKSVKGISVETLGKTGVAALEVGANSVFLTAQGFDITQSQHSIAVGPGVSFSSIGGSDQSKGVTGGGGLNYSYGVFGKNYKPYLRSMALYVEDAEHKYALKGEKVQK